MSNQSVNPTQIDGTLSISIRDPEVVFKIDKPDHVTYLIQTETTFPEFGGQEFSVRRRYTDFVWLRDELEKAIEHKYRQTRDPADFRELPPLPADTWKSFFYKEARFSEEFVDYRISGLQEFLDYVIDDSDLAIDKHTIYFLTASHFDKDHYAEKSQV
eukprot:TRINITY_DN8166_c0_g1_i1.p1 TRINITY_DN8166_c0_g1~~TRINITY_DN8166_c0_g1_i1.p1  ORF type:complete len:166 (+),score=39.68 TRINITY_DN8166_c0_g1_i1:26-499(+)